tara:strand:- start:1111 stop:1290 length:180 start_codon:yes stop_codon:yes gene_type:complete
MKLPSYEELRKDIITDKVDLVIKSKKKYVNSSPYKLIMGYDWSIKDERPRQNRLYRGIK